MAVDPQLLALMKDTVLIAPYTGQNEHGEATYGADVAYQCRITTHIMRVVVRTSSTTVAGAFEQVALSSAKIIIGSAPTVGARDRVTLPSGAQPRILEVFGHPDENGPYYTEVIV